MRAISIASLLLLLCLHLTAFAQTHNAYEISFANAVHHEAEIKATFTNLEHKVLEVRMSRTSPGRYALHEFAKNVYDVKAVDSKGEELEITRPNPHQWNISGHDGTVVLSYTLFANRGDGTYSQVDETHAHLNIPATFIYAPALAQRPVQVKFNVRDDLNWKVATQLKDLGDNLYYAPDLDYFMDSPTEISNYQLREFQEESNGKSYNIRLVLHHPGTEAELDEYFEKVKKVVQQEKAVFGTLPDFDYGTYTFLACYMPNASGDGMEHRNSTILTSTSSLAEGGMENNIGTVSHEFFHAWNVERIRPLTLKPFDYEEANMSGELWFAEGFTSYYTTLILCRAGLISQEAYINGLAGGLNYVWNSPALQYFTPIEMSYQAPFVDAARSVDPVNRENTFISYYTYGSVLGLALDLSLRNLEGGHTLDGYMRALWEKYGTTEQPYTIRDLQSTLAEYTNAEFANTFFSQFIFGSQMPDYENLLASVGVVFERANPEAPYFGAYVQMQGGKGIIATNPTEGSPAYKAGLNQGDAILALGDTLLTAVDDFGKLMSSFSVKETVEVGFERYGKPRKVNMELKADPAYATSFMEQKDEKPGKEMLQLRNSWLEAK
ncbi:putative metalloprotease with PDZ domain [Catalinimonas alkaloidigena]|uniref:M61 family metallopeptidase n=1 Tax=Catalinimonas alkaloidigena TaxID=1075417 RepID=UPI0024066A6D|nr:PDZ domain-containing protein [Catalinimonas alkaloidigena]MDF9798726.1 putative metalloprotease with PDZ domain [Catalinimonas alkaloidigena]